jgi:hypothetical protein
MVACPRTAIQRRPHKNGSRLEIGDSKKARPLEESGLSTQISVGIPATFMRTIEPSALTVGLGREA